MRVSYRAPSPISEHHDCSSFDCGKEELNRWLRETALKSEGSSARTYVVCEGAVVVGYYTLSAGGVFRASLPTAKSRRGMPNQIPVIIIGRLAVDRDHQGRGIAAGMLKEAILRSVEASRTIGVRGILVHAFDDTSIPFYAKYDFVPSPIDARTFILPIETAVDALR